MAALLRAHFLGEAPAVTVPDDRYDAGMAVRREVLGDAHVDRATAGRHRPHRATSSDFITEYAWGGVWTRPGLDRRSRSLITLTALIARGHHEELAMHLRAARTQRPDRDEIKEVLLQTAIYCGVPDANTAFRIAQQVLGDPTDEARIMSAFVYDAVRTPFGRFGGALAGVRPDDLAASVLARGRSTVRPASTRPTVDEVLLGNANGAGEDNRNVARMAVLLAGLPDLGARLDGQPAVRLVAWTPRWSARGRSRPATPTSCSPAASSR